MSIGPILKKAREDKKLTTSQLAKQTNMMVQIVEDLEKDDFSRIAATIYGKGFIKLYAEAVGLDPKPLIKDYMRMMDPDEEKAPSLLVNEPLATILSEDVSAVIPEKKQGKTEENTKEKPAENSVNDGDGDLFSFTTSKKSVKPISSQPDSFYNAKAVSGRDSGIRAEIGKIRKSANTLITKIAEKIADLRVNDLPIKAITVLICLAALLFFVVSGISRCSGKLPAQTAETSELSIAIDMPDPYFD